MGPGKSPCGRIHDNPRGVRSRGRNGHGIIPWLLRRGFEIRVGTLNFSCGGWVRPWDRPDSPTTDVQPSGADSKSSSQVPWDDPMALPTLRPPPPWIYVFRPRVRLHMLCFVVPCISLIFVFPLSMCLYFFCVFTVYCLSMFYLSFLICLVACLYIPFCLCVVVLLLFSLCAYCSLTKRSLKGPKPIRSMVASPFGGPCEVLWGSLGRPCGPQGGPLMGPCGSLCCMHSSTALLAPAGTGCTEVLRGQDREQKHRVTSTPRQTKTRVRD